MTSFPFNINAKEASEYSGDLIEICVLDWLLICKEILRLGGEFHFFIFLEGYI